MQGNPGASPELSRNGKHHCQSFGLSDELITNLAVMTSPNACRLCNFISDADHD